MMPRPRRNCPVPPKTASRRLRRRRERRRIAESPESLRISIEESNREGRGENAGRDCESCSEHYLQPAGAPAKPLRSGEHHRRPRTPSILPPPPSPSPLAFSSNGLKCEWVVPVTAVRVSKWNREGEGAEVCDVFDVNRDRSVACGRIAVPPHASEWQPLTAGWQPTCGRTDSHTAHAPRPTWRRKPAGLFQDSCIKLPTEMLACGWDGERPHVWALTFPLY